MDPGKDPIRHHFVHSPECNVKWKAYLDCINTENWITKYFFDSCGDFNNQMLLCFKKERRLKAEQNHKLADKDYKRFYNNLRKSVQEQEED